MDTMQRPAPLAPTMKPSETTAALAPAIRRGLPERDVPREHEGPVTPAVGMGATMYVGSDRYPYTVIAVSASGKQVTLQADRSEVEVPAKQYGDPITYSYHRDEAGKTTIATLRRDGTWCEKGGSHIYIGLGHRRRYWDPSF